MIRTLFIFLPVFILSSGIVLLLYYLDLEKNIAITKRHALDNTTILKEIVASDLQLIASDVLFLSEYHELKTPVEKKPFSNVFEDFFSFSKRKKIYDQIRFLDVEGMEIFRINDNNGNPRIVPKSELQSKAHHYYFKEAIELSQNQVFVSPFDLNIEHGKIEQPLKPTIRVGTPVFNNQNQKVGIVLLNYLGANLLQDFERALINAPGNVMLLNSNGFWLKGLKPEYEWGFMFENRKNSRFQNTFPDEWQQISKTESGQLINAKGLFTFVTIYPNIDISRTIDNKMSYSPENIKNHWTIVSHIQRKEISAVSSDFLKKLLVIYLPFIILFWIGSWILSYTSLKRRQAEQYQRKQYISYARFVPAEFLSLLNKDCVTTIKLADQLQREMTIFFSDIRSFTKISESLSSTEIFNLLCDYFKYVYPSIQTNQGFIDKFIGDAIMALFPESPEDSLRAAIEMKRQLLTYNEGRKKLGLVPIETGIGLHCGEVVLGTIGSEARMDTTVIGDNVNLASRIESLTKVFKVDIILSDSVYNRLHQPEDSYKLREIDTVRVKGKQNPVVLYEAFDVNEPLIIEQKSQSLAKYQLAIQHYKAGDFEEAIKMFKQCHEQCPQDSIPPIYITRCHTLLRIPPGPDWAGVSTL